MFGKGLKYDRIQGSFSIERGNAYTNNLFMDSAAADRGDLRTYRLVSEDYDQLVTVTPKLSSSLPFAPIWLVEKVIDKRIFDKVFAHQYTITETGKSLLLNQYLPKRIHVPSVTMADATTDTSPPYR